MRRAHFFLLASMTLTIGATLAACGSTVDSNNSGSGGSGGASSTQSSTVSSSGSGGEMDAGSDADNGKPSSVYPAPHPAPPTVVNCGGPVLATPIAYPIVFPSDPFATQIQDFTTGVGATDYWAANVTEYGVGALTGNPNIVVTEASPGTITDDDVQAFVQQHLDGTLLPQFPAPTGNEIYVIYYQANTTIQLTGQGQTSSSCHDFGGYHNNIDYQGQSVSYAVVPRCDNFDNFSGIDAVTAAASHELIEAVTDPYPNSNAPGYCQTDNNHIYWVFALGGGETGDMCAQNFTSPFTKFPPFDFTVQRAWSNKSALAGHDPCVPIPTGSAPYFNSVPVLKDFINLFGTQIQGIHIPAGGTGVVEVDLFSDGDTGGPWSVDAHDFAEFSGQGHQLDFNWDRTSGQNGEKLHLAITVEQASQQGVEIFYLSSHLNGVEHGWYGLVGSN